MGPDHPQKGAVGVPTAPPLHRPRRPPAHSPEERHHPHIRRRRRRRARRHLLWRRYGVLGVLLVGLGGLGTFAGSLLLTAWILHSPAHTPLTEQEENFRQIVMKTCEDTMLHVDCKCFWKASKTAYDDTNIMALMTALSERIQWGPAITRGRMENIAGPQATRLIGRALYDCVQM